MLFLFDMYVPRLKYLLVPNLRILGTIGSVINIGSGFQAHFYVKITAVIIIEGTQHVIMISYHQVWPQLLAQHTRRARHKLGQNNL